MKPLIGLVGRRKKGHQIAGTSENLHGIDIDIYMSDYGRAVREAGCVVVRQVVPERDVLLLQEALQEYMSRNPPAGGFPEDDPQVFEIYWSKTQVGQGLGWGGDM